MQGLPLVNGPAVWGAPEAAGLPTSQSGGEQPRGGPRRAAQSLGPEALGYPGWGGCPPWTIHTDGPFTRGALPPSGPPILTAMFLAMAVNDDGC